MITIRTADTRGKTALGWLTSWHSFSFNRYYDPAYRNFGPLLVLNDDHVVPGAGFSAHPHDNMEIVTWVLKGAVEHQDSTGTNAVIRAGEAQRMTAGTGVVHSEYNHSNTEPVHFLQVWFHPNEGGLPPSYEQRAFDADARRNALLPVASGEPGLGALSIRQDATMFASWLEAGRALTHSLQSKRGAYLYLVNGRLSVNGETISSGDAAMTTDEPELRLLAETDADFVLFDVATIFRTPHRIM